MNAVTLQTRIEEAQFLKEREREFLRTANRYSALARDAAFYGETDAADAYLEQMDKFQRMAHICALAAEDALTSAAITDVPLIPSGE